MFARRESGHISSKCQNHNLKRNEIPLKRKKTCTKIKKMSYKAMEKVK